MDSTAPNPKEYREIPGWVSYDEKQRLEISNDLGIFDKNELAVFFAVAEYADKYKTSYLPLQNFYKYLYEYGLRTNINALKVEDNIVALLRKVYYYLHRRNYCKAEMNDNKITAIILLDPQSLKPEEVQSLLLRLKREYESIKEDYDKPFITGDYVPKSGLSSKVISVVSIRELSQQKIADLINGAPLTKVVFPSNNDIVVLTEDLPYLLDLAFDKLKKHLSKNRDVSMLVLSKIKQQFQSLATVNKMDSILKASNVDSKLWAALTTEIMNMSLSNEKNSSIFQSSEIIKYMSILKSDEIQKKTHSDKSIAVLLKIMETYPLPFSKTQLLQMREKHAYLKLHSERDYIDLVNHFIKQYSSSEAVDVPPLLISVKVGEEQKYLYRNHFLTGFFEKLDSIAYEIKKQFTEKMDQKKEAFLKDPVMKTPDAFDNYVEEYFRKQDPMVVQLVENPALLYSLLVFYGKNDPNISSEISRFFYSPARENEAPHRRSISDILLVSWEKMLKEMKNREPFIYKIPIIGMILKWLQGFGKYMDKAVENQLQEKKKQPKLSQLLTVKKKQKEKPAPEQKEVPNMKEEKEKQKAKMIKEQMVSLQKKLIGNKSPEEMLSYFEGKWNRTINPDARKENVEMIKTKIQHRLGFMKKVTADTLRKEMMDMMRTEPVFKKVSDIESLKKYILLFMTKHYLSK